MLDPFIMHGDLLQTDNFHSLQ